MQIFAKQESREGSTMCPGDSLTDWRLSDPRIMPFPGRSRTMPDAVDYRFVNGWVATGDLPCREALRDILPVRSIALADCPPLPHLHVGGEDRRVDFSTFRFTPDLIARWARTTLQAEAPVRATFEAETCGSLRLWVGDTEALVFEPFDRNLPSTTRVTLDLPAGPVVLTVRVEDLHERDTSCFFRLTLVDGDGLTQPAPPPELAKVQAAMRSLRTDRMIYRDGPVRLMTDAPPITPLDVALRPDSLEGATMNVLAQPVTGDGAVTLGDGKPHDLIDTSVLKPGCIGLTLTTTVDGIEIRQGLGATVYPEPPRIAGQDLATRRAEAKALIAADGGTTPSRALILIEAGRVDEALPLLEPALRAVEARHDCADFFLLPLLRLWRDNRSALPVALQARLKAAILGFRYWLDEPGNDVMWFWSENHVLCFHASQHVAGALFPDEVFGASGRTGQEQQAIGAQRLGRWFASIEAEGFAEWNSAAYYPIDFIGLLTLVDMSPMPDMATRARAQCDALFEMIALHTIGGTPAGSQGRAYEKELFAGAATELGALAAVAFGGPFVPGYERAAALYALSRHEVPAHLAPLLDVPPGRTLQATYVQGLDASAKLNLWKSDAAQLSSVADHKTGAAGHQQHVVDLAMAADPFARVWVNHPGDLKPWGGSRPSLWAGSGVVPRVGQSGNIALMIFDLDRQEHPIGFTHAMVPAEVMDAVDAEGHWIFARKGDGYAALWANAPPECQTHGLYAGSEWRSAARQGAWVVVAGAASVHGDFAAFKDMARGLAPDFDATALRLSAGDLALDHDGPLKRGGVCLPAARPSIRPHVGWDGTAPVPLSAETIP